MDGRAAADASRRRLPAAARGGVRDRAGGRRRHRRRECAVRGAPGDARAAGDRDEPARVALVRARKQGDRLPDREARCSARGRATRSTSSRTTSPADDRGVRAGARLRRRQGAAIRVREVPVRGSAARRRDARDRGGARPRPHVRRGVHEGVRGARGSRRAFPASDEALVARASASRCPSGGTCFSRRRGADSSCPASIRTSPSSCARSHAEVALGRPARQAGGRLVRRRVRGSNAVLLRRARGRGRRPAAVGPRRRRARRRAESHRAGDRVRLLLRARRAR